MNILIVPGTTEIAKEILRSLLPAKGVKIFGAGTDLERAKSLGYSTYFYLPHLDQDSLALLEDIIRENGIELVYLAHDAWLYSFRGHLKIANAQVISNSKSSLDVASFKSKTYLTFLSHLDVPRTYLGLEEITDFPVFLKPDRGQGSNGARIINSADELEFCNVNGQFSEDWIVSEYLPGPEYTIDCFSDLDSNLIFVSQRERCAIEQGKAVETRFVEISSKVYGWARKISNVLSLKGAWFFQIKIAADNGPRLLEIGLRIAGASGINRLRGINLSLLNYYLYTKPDSKIKIVSQFNTPTLDRGTFDLGFEFEVIFVDLDDTLVVNGARNQSLVEFLAQKYYEGKKIKVITRRSKDIDKFIHIAGIGDIVEKVIQVPDDQAKSSYILPGTRFLFIDDSFREQLDVKSTHGNNCLVLDPSFSQQG